MDRPNGLKHKFPRSFSLSNISCLILSSSSGLLGVVVSGVLSSSLTLEVAENELTLQQNDGNCLFKLTAKLFYIELVLVSIKLALSVPISLEIL